MRFPILMTVLLLVALQPAKAVAAACYTAVETEAEQALRIHSELMVIALTCMKSPEGGADLYRRYETFTARHQTLLADYEKDMLRYYRKQGGGAEQKLHSLRTHLANQISQHAITMSVDQFCARFAPRIDQALKMDDDKLRRWAQQTWPGAPTTVAACGSAK